MRRLKFVENFIYSIFPAVSSLKCQELRPRWQQSSLPALMALTVTIIERWNAHSIWHQAWEIDAETASVRLNGNGTESEKTLTSASQSTCELFQINNNRMRKPSWSTRITISWYKNEELQCVGLCFMEYRAFPVKVSHLAKVRSGWKCLKKQEILN